jgi:hypothetical protein
VSLDRARGDKDEKTNGCKDRAIGASQAWTLKQFLGHIHPSDFQKCELIDGRIYRSLRTWRRKT